MDYVTEAKALGFTDAALMPVRELVIVPEYRVFCEENLCGNYNVLPACPPASGTVEEGLYRSSGAEGGQAAPERADRAADKPHARKRHDGYAHDGRGPLENGLVHVGLLRKRAEDGGLCGHEVLGK